MFLGSVCDKSRLVSSWWHHVSWIYVWQIEPSEQLMTPCFLALCVTNRALWAADTMFPGSMCDKSGLVSSWWHHVSWLHVWQIEPSEQLMTLCFLALCVTNRNPVCLDVKCLVFFFFFLCMWNLPPLLSSEWTVSASANFTAKPDQFWSSKDFWKVFSVVVSAYLFETGLEKRKQSEQYPNYSAHSIVNQ